MIAGPRSVTAAIVTTTQIAATGSVRASETGARRRASANAATAVTTIPPTESSAAASAMPNAPGTAPQRPRRCRSASRIDAKPIDSAAPENAPRSWHADVRRLALLAAAAP